MEILINCLIQIALGFVGMVIVIVFMVQDYIRDSVFDRKMFMCKHKWVMILTTILIILLSVTINLVPESGEMLKVITTMNITTEPHSFLLLSTAMYAMIYSKSRANQRSKERKEEE